MSSMQLLLNQAPTSVLLFLYGNKSEMRTYYKEARESFTNTSTLFLPPQL
jgi:hypothetical protein